MLVNLRNAMMAGKRLPYDAELEYLESTGTQWIDTRVLANGEFDVEYTIQTPPSADVTSLFMVGGARSTSQHLNFGQYEGKGQFTLGYLGNYWWAAQAVVAANTLYTVKIHYANGSQTATINGTNATSNSLRGTEALNLNIYLFKRNYYGASDDILPMKGRMYAFKIWQNGVLVRDFIPVRVGTAGYLYDRVSKRLFGNAGTGDFVLGPDVVPVEYIESYGTEWIDTGFKANTTTTRFECGIVPNDILTTQGVFGSRNYPNTAAHDACNIFVISGKFRLDWGSGNGTNPYTATVGQDYTMSITRGIATINGTNITFENTQSITQDNNFLIGNFTNGSSTPYSTGFIGKWKWAKLYSNDNAAYSFRPVRVGTGSTWAGAMMDVLTRRVYRNAGTGAFTYGNDLKHPIPSE